MTKTVEIKIPGISNPYCTQIWDILNKPWAGRMVTVYKPASVGKTEQFLDLSRDELNQLHRKLDLKIASIMPRKKKKQFKKLHDL